MQRSVTCSVAVSGFFCGLALIGSILLTPGCSTQTPADASGRQIPAAVAEACVGIDSATLGELLNRYELLMEEGVTRAEMIESHNVGCADQCAVQADVDEQECLNFCEACGAAVVEEVFN
jgi:hypothetical protein